MQPSIRRKLEQLAERHEELEPMLASPEVLGDANRLREVSREHSHLTPLTESLRAYDQAGTALESAQAMRKKLGERCPRLAAVTANAFPGAREEYLSKGFDDYLSKPLLPDSLRQLISRAEKKPPGTPSS